MKLIILAISHIALIFSIVAPSLSHAMEEKGSIKIEIGLYIVENGWLDHILSCHGRAEECADDDITYNGDGSYDQKQRFIDEINTAYKKYSNIYSPQILKDSFYDALSVFAKSKSSTYHPEVRLVTLNNLAEFQEVPSGELYVIKTHLEKTTDPEIAYISYSVYDVYDGMVHSPKKGVESNPRITSFPINLSEEQYKERLKKFTVPFYMRSAIK